MARNPTSTILLYKKVPFSNDYQDSLWLESGDISDVLGTPYTQVIYQNYSFVRDGAVRISSNNNTTRLSFDLLSLCNYMEYTNNITGLKHFCFITDCKYINDSCVELTFEDDVIQTYLFANKDLTGVQLLQSFIVRQHSETDEIGDNLQPENVSIGQYEFTEYENVVPIRELAIIASVADIDGGVSGRLYDNVYGGTKLYAFHATSSGATALSSFLVSYLAHPDSVVALYMVPKYAIKGPDDFEDGHLIQDTSIGKSYVQVYAKPEDSSPYNFRNKKMYTYPYCYFHVDNGCGQSLQLRYEFFDAVSSLEKNAPYLKFNTTVTQPARVMCNPVGYKGVGKYTELTGYKDYLNETITLDNYPICSFTADSFESWLYTSAVPQLVIGGATMAVSKELGAFNIGSLVSQAYQAYNSADITRGNASAGNVNCAHARQTFNTAHAHLRYDNAKSIDDYFTCYGYAQNKYGIPNLHARENYTYIKTQDFKIKGAIPNDAINKIKAAFNSGITFWTSISNVGNYALENATL